MSPNPKCIPCSVLGTLATLRAFGGLVVKSRIQKSSVPLVFEIQSRSAVTESCYLMVVQ